MTPADLRTAADLLFGGERFGLRWQRPLARALGVDDRTVRRWLSGESPVPEEIVGKLYWLAVDRREELARLMGMAP